MPLIVTDADVLAQIAVDDGLAASLAGQASALGAKIPPATLAAWTADAAAYATWASLTKVALGGGFVFGAWFGVPEMGNQAIAWGLKLGAGIPAGSPGGPSVGWQTIFNAIAQGQTPPAIAAASVSPDSVASANATAPPLPGPDPSTKILIAAALGLGLLLVLKR